MKRTIIFSAAMIGLGVAANVVGFIIPGMELLDVALHLFGSLMVGYFGTDIYYEIKP